MSGMANHVGAVNSTGGLDITSLLSGLLNFAIAAFAILLVVGVVVAAIVFINRYLFDGVAAQGKQVCKTSLY